MSQKWKTSLPAAAGISFVVLMSLAIENRSWITEKVSSLMKSGTAVSSNSTTRGGAQSGSNLPRTESIVYDADRLEARIEELESQVQDLSTIKDEVWQLRYNELEKISKEIEMIRLRIGSIEDATRSSRY